MGNNTVDEKVYQEMVSDKIIEKLMKKHRRKYAFARLLASSKKKKTHKQRPYSSECISSNGYALGKEEMIEIQQKSKKLWKSMTY